MIDLVQRLLPKAVSAKAWPSRIATGVRLIAIGDVADRMDRRHAGARIVVDLDPAKRRRSATPTFSRPSPWVFGSAAGREQHHIGVDRLAAGAMERRVSRPAVRLDAVRRCSRGAP